MTVHVSAQFTGVDASNYPTVRAYGTGPFFNNAKTTDFTVLENGIDMKATLKSQCNTVLTDPALSVVLVIDKSGSMGESVGGGKIRMDWVKDGAKAFVNNLDFSPNTWVAVITFDGNTYLESAFQNTAAPLIEAIDKIEFSNGGSTHYDPPFLDPTKGAIALLNTRPAWIRRMIIFLTDGFPNMKPSTSTIISKLISSKIKAYAITTPGEASNELRDIITQSGGQTYRTNDANGIINIYKSLSGDRPTVTYCWLEWISPPGCNQASTLRNVNLQHRPTNTRGNFSYTAPQSSISGIVNSVISLPPFADIPVGNTAQSTFTISAANADMNITGASVIPAGNFSVINWGGTNPPFILTKGTSRTITVQFTQTAPRDARSAQLIVNGTPCSSPPVLLSGGIKKITLLTPNGGEIYSTCDSILITWTGVDPTDSVMLEYSSDLGSTWQNITPLALQNSYQWKPPSAGSYMVRVSPYTPKIGIAWTRSGGGTSGDSSNAIATSADGSIVYIAGTFNKSITFDNRTITSSKAQEAFLTQYNSGRVAWALSGVSMLNQFSPYTYSMAQGVMVDKADKSAYVMGEVIPNSTSKRQIFLGKYFSNGTANWMTSITSTLDIFALRLGFDSATNYVYVEGRYSGVMKVTLKNGMTASLNTTPINPKIFLAIFDPDGKCTYIQDSTFEPAFNPRISKDSLGNTFETGTYSGNLVSGDTTISSRGSKDVFIRRIGRIYAPSDQSDAVCTVAAPYFSFGYQPLTVGISQVGEFHDTTFTAFICNRGTYPITLTDYKFEGNYPADFALVSALKGVTLQKDSCLQVTIRFTASATGYRSAYLRVWAGCTDQQVILTGFGIELDANIDSLNWGRKRIYTDNSQSMIIRNTGTADITLIKLSLENTPDNNFIPVFPTLPLIISPQDSIELLIFFNPQDTLSYQNSVFAEIEGFSKPLVGTLTGYGFLPGMIGKGYAFKPTYLNTLSPELGTCSILNPSTTSDVLIREVKFIDNPGDFAWSTNPPTNFSVQQSSTELRSFDVRFTPKAVGLRTAHVEISSDAAPGPNVSPIKLDTIVITGIGYFTPLEVDSVIDFGAVLTCDSPGKSIIIKNLDPQNPIKITKIDRPNFIQAFTLSPTNSITIPAGGSDSILVQFSPDSSSSYSEILTLTTETGEQFTVRLSGSGYISTGLIKLFASGIDTSREVREVEIGGNYSNFSISAQANIADLVGTKLTNLTLDLHFDPHAFGFRYVDVWPLGWNWDIDSVDQHIGIIRFIGTAVNPQSLTGQRFWTANFTTYLAKDSIYPFVLKAQNNRRCLDLTTQNTDLHLDLTNVCFGIARVIEGTGNTYYLSAPHPNPSSEIVTFDIGVGLTTSASISICNSMGEVVHAVTFPQLVAGEHQISLNLDKLSAGLYNVRYSAGHFTETTKLVIVK
ncbi:MAG: choice-of-anchor D domain-containing protein [Ignavibacteria bacterium]|nr:choice-of-anchor D domain-containing protein [Ignavibacteria bacterium]